MNFIEKDKLKNSSEITRQKLANLKNIVEEKRKKIEELEINREIFQRNLFSAGPRRSNSYSQFTKINNTNTNNNNFNTNNNNNFITNSNNNFNTNSNSEFKSITIDRQTSGRLKKTPVNNKNSITNLNNLNNINNLYEIRSPTPLTNSNSTRIINVLDKIPKNYKSYSINSNEVIDFNKEKKKEVEVDKKNLMSK